MLDLIRKKQKALVIKVVFWAIIATFVGTIFLVWGKGGSGDSQEQSFAVKVNDETVSLEEYQLAYGNLYRMYQNVYRDQFTPEMEKQLKLRQQALDALVEQALLLQEAEQLGLSVSNKELVESIAKIPAFQKDGTFDKEIYVQVLRSQRLLPDQFEALQKRDLLVGKVRERIRQEAGADDAAIEQEYRDRNEKIELHVARLSPVAFERQVRIDPAALQNYYKEHAEQFRRPETVELNYVVFDAKGLTDQITLSDEDLERFYRRHLDRYELPEQVRAAHILLRVDADADAAARAKVKAQAEIVLAQAKGGKDFADLAKRYSQDPGSALRGGDLGHFGRGSMVPAFETAAFALKPGAISDLVETPFGYHIIKLIEHREASVKPLSAVKDEVVAELRQEKAQQLAMEKALDAYNIHRKAGGIEAAAKSAGLTIKRSGFFGREEAAGPLGSVADIQNSAFALAAGELGRPVKTQLGVVLYGVREKRDSAILPLVEVQAAVEQAYRQEQGKVLAQRAAAALLASAKGGNLESLARQQGIKLEQTGLFARNSGNFIPQVGASEPLMKAAFTLTAASPTIPEPVEIAGEWVVATLRQRQSADPAKLDAATRDELRSSVLSRKQDELYNKKIEELKGKAKIVYSTAMEAALEG